MQRREFLLTAGFAGGLALGADHTAASTTDGSRPGSPPDTNVKDECWFLTWLPPSLTRGKVPYSFGASPARPSPTDGDRSVRLVTDHSMLHASVGADTDEVRRSVQKEGYERLSDRVGETYGRSDGRRFRVVALDDGTAIRGVGPAPRPVLDRVQTVADGDGTDDPGDVLVRLFEEILPADHLSIDYRPAPGIAGVGERVINDGDRSRLQTVLLPDPGDGGVDPKRYLPEIKEADGVLSTTVTRRGRALVREATVRTADLRDQLEGRHGL